MVKSMQLESGPRKKGGYLTRGGEPSFPSQDCTHSLASSKSNPKIKKKSNTFSTQIAAAEIEKWESEQSDLIDPTAMGLSSLPTPSEGVLTLILVNTALTVSILKELARSVLHVLGLRTFPPAPDPAVPASDRPSEPTLTDRFRSRFKPIRFGSAFGQRPQQAVDCRVCLTRFEPDSVVNRLPCGHHFHKACLERWLDYHHATCPLCRSLLLPAFEPSSAASSSPS
ncbi:probable E3 ubiquitin-protein ligase XERICO [Phoenix dactylifera]|uniref:Probable E3 ubiquitin-protein ligase XERICO n=1 Tax=Phoenix dactylifera TaxID=42345 RepID=A0A8B7CP49_PHODC|nr:probable E3 ubiquitin-protein ligase XERICO [Phoenix dactylifera]